MASKHQDYAQALENFRDSLVQQDESARQRIADPAMKPDTRMSYLYILEEMKALFEWSIACSRVVFVHSEERIQRLIATDMQNKLDYYIRYADHPVQWRGNAVFEDICNELLTAVKN